jgi:predicted metal-binding membrane protein
MAMAGGVTVQGLSPGSDVPTSSVWRDRATYAIGAALLGLAGIAWVGVVLQGAGMTSDAGSLSLPGALVFLVAWGVMMAAMMLPSATPMIVMYDKVIRSLPERDRAIPTALFVALYFAIWLSLGVLVYLAGAAVSTIAEANPNVAGSLPYVLAAVLVAAGAYQFTPLKQACLRHCRSPVSFLMARWRSGYAGTVRLAAAHAAYCVGCCAALMVVLVAAGAMSLPWVLLVASIVFVEKLFPRGELSARLVGVGFVILGLVIAVDPELAAMLRGPTM